MIEITKGPTPQVLIDNCAVWTARWVRHILYQDVISETDKSRYRHADIKVALQIEAHGKCVYCESKITHVYFGDVEHILPKRKIPELFVSWHNLALACAVCNNAKGDYYSAAVPLIDPYEDKPSLHLRFHGPLIFNRPGSIRGEVTRAQVDLKRPALVERRSERIEALKPLIDRYCTCTTDELRALLLSQIKLSLAAEAEYAGCLRDFARDHAGIEV